MTFKLDECNWDIPPLGIHGVGLLMRPAPLEHIRVLAMGVVKPANDDEEFYRMTVCFTEYPLPPAQPQ